ncbi:MAG: hypothetical protein NTY53_21500 [Kiritimatiellaeota bacterium]|nr:hypothetical protein [Kiritimatiellota bacterium]
MKQQLAVISAALLSALSANALNIPAGNRPVTYTDRQVVNVTNRVTVATVRVQSVSILKVGTNALAVFAPFQWLDASNRVLRTGVRRLDEAQLAEVLGAKFAAQKTALLALIPSGTALFNGLTLRLNDSGTMTASVPFTETQSGVTRTGMATLNETALASRGVDVPALKALLPRIVDAVVR